MARQRMYLFERAYVDYGERLREFVNRLWKTCGKILGWSVDGEGGFKVVGVIVGIIMLLIAITILINTIADVFGEIRIHGFFASIPLIIFSIWAYPILLRIYSIITAIATTIVWAVTIAVTAVAVALAGSSLAIVTFSSYLLVLILLTALSVVAFLPIRGVHALWLLYRHITYRCPYDDCAYSGLPIHIGGGEQYADLQPNFYGIFHHTCRNPDGTEVKLPTLDFLGRNKLPRLCGGCKRPLIFSSFGELAEKPIAIVGGPTAGKTLFLRQAVSQLQAYLSALPGSRVQIDSEQQQRELEADRQRLQSGQVVAKTVNQAMAFGLAVRLSRRWRHLLYLYDAPGEDFLTMQRFGQKQALQHIAGLILLIDPFSLAGLASYRERLPVDQEISEVPLQQVVDVLLNGVNTMLVKQPTDTCAVPLAVVINKADALPVIELPFLAALQPGGSATSADCRQALERLGERASVHKLESKFTRIQYFAGSALGRMPDRRNASPFQPVGVIEPLLWLLGLDKKSH